MLGRNRLFTLVVFASLALISTACSNVTAPQPNCGGVQGSGTCMQAGVQGSGT
jgi:hypothetical protein